MVETVALKDHLNSHQPGIEFTVGRTPNNTLVLDHDELPLLISRQHAKFSIDDGRITLWDMGATNGTWINDMKLPSGCSACLEPGDTVSFGGPACVMRQGRPVQNPFQYVFEEPVATDSDSEVGILEIEDSEPIRLERPTALSRLVESDGRIHDVQDGSGSEAGSPMHITELPRLHHIRSNRSSPVRSLFQDPSSTVPSPEHGDLSSMQSPRVRERDIDRSNDANPSPTKRGRFAPRTASSTPSHLKPHNKAGPVVLAEAQLSTLQTLESQLECVICQEWMVAPHSLVPCGHMYCGGCLYNLLRCHQSHHGPTCPTCRSEVTAAPVKCLPVDNILSDLVERTLDPEALNERTKRRQKWDRAAARASEAWKEYFVRRHGGGVPRVRHRGPALPVDSYQQTNFNLGSMLDNLRQVRETLRSVTNPSGGAAAEGQAAARPDRVSFAVDYARSSRSRCVHCRNGIEARTLRVGLQREEIHGNQVPYVATRWHHVGCVPEEMWARMHRSGIHGLRSLAAQDQMNIGNAMSRAMRTAS